MTTHTDASSALSSIPSLERQAAHVLVVDDDRRLRALLEKYLTSEGFLVDVAKDAAAATELLKYLIYDAMVLDVMMPGQTGLELSQQLRESHPHLPVLLLTALGESEDRIKGLKTGAADYLPKPFEPEELVLRLNNIMARGAGGGSVGRGGHGGQRGQGAQIQFGRYVFDLNRQELFDGEAMIKLSTTEAKLLSALGAARGDVVTRQKLKDICDLKDSNDRTVDVQMTRLRKKIEDDPGFPKYLKTIRGEGYMLQVDTFKA